MSDKKAIDELLALVRADPTDVRSHLKLGDLYAKTGDIRSAVSLYESVAKHYAHHGFALKAVAVYKQICSLIVTRAPELRDRYRHVPPILSDLFRRLGLEADAVAALDVLAFATSDNHRGS